MLGVPVTVDVDDDALRSTLSVMLASSRASNVGSGISVEITVGEEDAILRVNDQVAFIPPGASVVEELLTRLNGLVVERFEGLAVHAGVIARGGDAVAFPAPSGAGKSTLVAACLRAGFDYVSDEAMCIDEASGGVVPYPKPLSLSPWSCGAVGVDFPSTGSGQSNVVARQLGAVDAPGPLRLRHVVLCERTRGAPALQPRHPSDAVAALLRMSFNHYKRPALAVETACQLAASAQCWTLRVGDPMAAAQLVAERLPSC